ncbi:MAG: RraA family protein [Bryobacteraceae bacterium]
MSESHEIEFFEQIPRTLYTAAVGDVLDSFGFHHQFLPQPIQPLREDMRVVGRAMPVLIADVFGSQNDPFGKLTEALDQIRAGEVYVATGTLRCASWGEILTASAKNRGAVGAVIDGFHRDTPRVLEQNWPVFSRGRFAQDAGVRSQVIAYRCHVEIGGVKIHPGDLVLGDVDGVVVVPRTVEQDIVNRALEKSCRERVVRREIEAGATSTAVFSKYGIL